MHVNAMHVARRGGANRDVEAAPAPRVRRRVDHLVIEGVADLPIEVVASKFGLAKRARLQRNKCSLLDLSLLDEGWGDKACRVRSW